MTVNHKDLTTTALHEPKGVAAASANTVYGSNGSGSGTWAKIDVANMDTSSVKNVNRLAITYEFTNMSTATSKWVAVPLAGKILKIYSVMDDAITNADNVFTFEIGGTAVTLPAAYTIAVSGSGVGVTDNSTPSGNNTLTVGQPIEIISSGASTGATDITFTFLLDVA